MKIFYAACLVLLSTPAMAQESMTFGHATPRPAAVQKPTYQRTRVPRGSTLIVKNPNECSVPTSFIGQPIDVMNHMRFNKPVRIIRPGDGMTMDHNPQRLNIMLDERDVIMNIMCG